MYTIGLVHQRIVQAQSLFCALMMQVTYITGEVILVTGGMTARL